MEYLEQVTERYSQQRSDFARLEKRLCDLIKDLIDRKGIDVFSIESRTKSIESFREKIRRPGKSYADPIKEITDLVGIRLICYFTKDVDKMCRLIRDPFQVDSVASVDKRPKYNELGYRSRHLIVSLGDERTRLAEYREFEGIQAEVQVRTISEHTWAAIEHKYNYKNTKELEDSIRRRLFRIQAVLEMCDDEFSRLRDDVEKGREKLQDKIRSDRDIKVNAETLRAFMDSKSTFYESVLKALRDNGLKFRKRSNTDHSQFAFAAEQAISSGYKTIQSIEDLFYTTYTKDRVDAIEHLLLGFYKDRNRIILQTDVVSFLTALERPYRAQQA